MSTLTLKSLIWHTRHDDAGIPRDMASPIIKLTPGSGNVSLSALPVTIDRRKLERDGRWDPHFNDPRGLPTFFLKPGTLTRGRR